MPLKKSSHDSCCVRDTWVCKEIAEDESLVPEVACGWQGFIWRDCKPENILVSGKSRGRVMLADFGLSINATEERPVTRAGTLDYMAPEVRTCPVHASHTRAMPTHLPLAHIALV